MATPNLSNAQSPHDLLIERARAALAPLTDPEIPVLTLDDLGIIRDIAMSDGVLEVSIMPTYTGCPATATIRLDVEIALARAGLEGARVRSVLAPAWSTEFISPEGRAKLAAYGIAPPPKTGRRGLFGEEAFSCPRCGSGNTERLSEFGSTACKAYWRCRVCREPFDAFKCI